MLPILLNTTENNFSALIVGGGRVALRRVRWLLDCGIDSISIISPTLLPEFSELSSTNISIFSGEYSSKLNLSDYTLILACTNQQEVNDQIESDARRYRILFNRADKPDSSDFHIPATINHDDITLSINSGVPALSRRIRDDIARILPDDISEISTRLKIIRTKLINHDFESTEISSILSHLCKEENYTRLKSIDTDSPDLISEIKRIAID